MYSKQPGTRHLEDVPKSDVSIPKADVSLRHSDVEAVGLSPNQKLQLYHARKLLIQETATCRQKLVPLLSCLAGSRWSQGIEQLPCFTADVPADLTEIMQRVRYHVARERAAHRDFMAIVASVILQPE